MHLSLAALAAEVERAFPNDAALSRTFRACLPNTLETSVRRLDDGSTFVVTGDIPAMWLRDAAAQVWPYVQHGTLDDEVRGVVAGVVRTQARQLLTDPYANAFNADPTGDGHVGDLPERHPLVWERKFELDSLCYPVRLAYRYWRVTRDVSPFDATFHEAMRTVVKVMRTEQRHAELSDYAFWRPGDVASTDNLPNGGRGHDVAFTGMIWQAFRPSDDACELNYNVPGNMMAAVELAHLAELAEEVLGDEGLASEARSLRAEVEAGVEAHGVVHHPTFGRMYAYETDGLGRHVLMDDANVPSLLAIPYLGYRPAVDVTYQNTRRFVLSAANPTFHTGAFARGVGSPHTPGRRVWPIAIAMAGLTATSDRERRDALHTLVATTAGTNLMHESFDPDDPAVFTREWFGWANGMFAELALACARAGVMAE